MEAWYALYTKPNAEALVVRGLEARGLKSFLPLLPPTGSQTRGQPLFPSYLFLQADLSEVMGEALAWLPGLRGIVSFAGRPAIVPLEAIELMEKELVEIEAAGGLPAHPFKPGDSVVIDDGPLAGLLGVFQGPVGPAERVRILVGFLGQSNRAEVPLRALRKIGESDFRTRRRGTRGHGRRIHYEA